MSESNHSSQPNLTPSSEEYSRAPGKWFRRVRNAGIIGVLAYGGVTALVNNTRESAEARELNSRSDAMLAEAVKAVGVSVRNGDTVKVPLLDLTTLSPELRDRAQELGELHDASSLKDGTGQARPKRINLPTDLRPEGKNSVTVRYMPGKGGISGVFVPQDNTPQPPTFYFGTANEGECDLTVASTVDLGDTLISIKTEENPNSGYKFCSLQIHSDLSDIQPGAELIFVDSH